MTDKSKIGESTVFIGTDPSDVRDADLSVQRLRDLLIAKKADGEVNSVKKQIAAIKSNAAGRELSKTEEAAIQELERKRAFHEKQKEEAEAHARELKAEADKRGVKVEEPGSTDDPSEGKSTQSPEPGETGMPPSGSGEPNATGVGTGGAGAPEPTGTATPGTSGGGQTPPEPTPPDPTEAPVGQTGKVESPDGPDTTGGPDRPDSPEVSDSPDDAEEIAVAVAEDLGGEDSPAEAALIKDVDDLTEKEVRAAVGSDTYWKASDPNRAALLDKVTLWHDRRYGTAPQKLDWTGKPIRPDFVAPPPTTARPTRDAEGTAIASALQSLGRHAARLAEGRGTARKVEAVSTLQRGLNYLRQGNEGRLKVDGIAGPRTRLAARKALVAHGRKKAEEAVSLGRFEAAAGRAAQGEGIDLDRETGASFGVLFQPAARPAVNRAVQDAVNELAAEDFSPRGFKALKDDGVIGPKTLNAFSQVARAAGPAILTKKLGDTLGFL